MGFLTATANSPNPNQSHRPEDTDYWYNGTSHQYLVHFAIIVVVSEHSLLHTVKLILQYKFSSVTCDHRR